MSTKIFAETQQENEREKKENLSFSFWQHGDQSERSPVPPCPLSRSAFNLDLLFMLIKHRLLMGPLSFVGEQKSKIHFLQLLSEVNSQGEVLQLPQIYRRRRRLGAPRIRQPP